MILTKEVVYVAFTFYRLLPESGKSGVCRLLFEPTLGGREVKDGALLLPAFGGRLSGEENLAPRPSPDVL